MGALPDPPLPSPDAEGSGVQDCPKRRNGGVRLVETKTNASRRSISLPPPLVEELRLHRREQVQESLRLGPAHAEG